MNNTKTYFLQCDSVHCAITKLILFHETHSFNPFISRKLQTLDFSSWYLHWRWLTLGSHNWYRSWCTWVSWCSWRTTSCPSPTPSSAASPRYSESAGAEVSAGFCLLASFAVVHTLVAFISGALWVEHNNFRDSEDWQSQIQYSIYTLFPMNMFGM